MALLLNMIVKDEGARILRALDSAAPYVSAFAITDTGSTDDTIAKIREWSNIKKIPGIVNEAPFIDWAQARNVALNLGRTNAPAWGCDYLLLIDADMELVVKDAHAFDNLTGPSYDMYQKGGTLEYLNRRLVRADTVGQYVGVTHEYLDVEATGSIPLDAAFFTDHADGANRPDKFKRDIRLLREGLKNEPHNSRYFFYLAQSYRDAGEIDKAIKWFKRRVEAGGWPEEQWYAQYCLANCYGARGNDDEFVKQMLKAFNMRPARAESLYQLANHSRLKGDNGTATMYADMALHTPKSTDALFVDTFKTSIGPMEEFGICGFYLEHRRKEAFEITSALSIMGDAPGGTRDTARANMYFYLPFLKDIAPSFEWETMKVFEPAIGYTPMNPSVANHNGQLWCVVRHVNYTMDNDGRYLIKDTNGEANDSNPINTRNVLVRLDENLKAISQSEILPSTSQPAPLFKPVIGFEDMRLFTTGAYASLWTSSCVREMNAEGYCEQVLARIHRHDVEPQLTDVTRMLRAPRVYEKNWMPITGRLMFMYRLGHVIDAEAKDVKVHPDKVDVGGISGGSQVIPFGDGWLCVVHEARALPDTPHKRYYYHRFVSFTHDFKISHVSLPFCFNDKLIEFCAGLCWHPDGKRLVISYGWQDKEARIATIHHHDVEKLLWFASKS